MSSGSTMTETGAYEPEMSNKATVEALYEALALGDAETASSLLASDLEWWFHGPPSCQYMMRILTGQSTHREFTFLPQNVTAIGAKVFVEGWEGDSVYWVHVWTVKDGTITQVREYFNTWITVRDLRPPRRTHPLEERPRWSLQPLPPGAPRRHLINLSFELVSCQT